MAVENDSSGHQKLSYERITTTEDTGDPDVCTELEDTGSDVTAFVIDDMVDQSGKL
ncbi:hypothetical protein [Natrinema salinisoli]|uniref:hypothetical protein n=1 Tax=Natrinema salinisoli TaxID=2878535 RepID=UPI001CF07C78|nr:hypothetical protein [Natrinema salinisoli]